ncbi:uncharacterized protein MELLADRAFT_113985 [Melampsora larici-populina 98AG31]|uniref:Uncharacterized protein n=1 Tax=Melampsora larici-populina (strain 98AG31 / pathotype 3-4-7) TaxID=747676 RepID=F4SBR5_MELLP|nr:uncharacterized protein MELLADRAFT_113985 [Melampsora larici-populina 98AG31]EGF97911.1 hypothetical protein MELLADRAFT_113985 [Melampsora larici-populina 98AG31]
MLTKLLLSSQAHFVLFSNNLSIGYLSRYQELMAIRIQNVNITGNVYVEIKNIKNTRNRNRVRPRALINHSQDVDRCASPQIDRMHEPVNHVGQRRNPRRRAANTPPVARMHQPVNHVGQRRNPRRRAASVNHQHNRPIKRNLRMRVSLEEDPRFWRKALTLPDHLIQYMFPECSLWDYSTTRRVLRALIEHFDPGYYLRKRMSKTELVKTYQDVVYVSSDFYLLVTSHHDVQGVEVYLDLFEYGDEATLLTQCYFIHDLNH